MHLTARDIARLFDEHSEELLGFFVRRTFLPDVGLDLLGETFAEAFASRETFRGSGTRAERAWLYGIAHHLLADYVRRGRVERQALARLGVEADPLTDAEYDHVERTLMWRGLRELVATELDALPAAQREALHLRVVEEQSYESVAFALDVTPQTARARVSRALRALAESPALAELREAQRHA